MEAALITTCGANCNVCAGYLGYKYDIQSKGIRAGYCKGCDSKKSQCTVKKKKCKLPPDGQVKYCYECAAFPCSIIQQIDKRYRAHHHTSMIENLEYIRDNGMEKFLEQQEEKWKCPECGDVICCHNGICYSCGLEKLKNKQGNKYRWEGEK